MSTLCLADAQVEAFHECGYLSGLPVLSAAEVVHYRTQLTETEKRLTAMGAPRLVQPHLFFPWAYELVTHPLLLNTIEALLGPDLLVHTTSVFRKEPDAGRFVSWHQDSYYYGFAEPKMVTVWLAFTPSTHEMGCLQVLPGSHAGELPHGEYTSENNLLNTGLTVKLPVDESAVQSLELEAGQASVHHLNMVHGSGPNRSNRVRTGFVVRYVPTSLRQKKPHQPVVLARGHDRFGHYDHLTEKPIDMESGLAEALAFSLKMFRTRFGKS